MRKLALPLLFVLGLLAAGALSASVVAQTLTTTGSTSTGSTDATTVTTTDETTTDETGTTTTTPEPRVIPTGVTIGGIDVGDMTRTEAKETLQAANRRMLPVRIDDHRVKAGPGHLGVRPHYGPALDDALNATPYEVIPLDVRVAKIRVKRFVAKLAKQFATEPRDAKLIGLRNLRPKIRKERLGRELGQKRTVSAIVDAFKANYRTPVWIEQKRIKPAVTRKNFGPIVVIRRGSNHLYLYKGMRLWRDFGVATGQPAYPTPIGHFHIIVKWKNPWWYPPDSSWARGAKPIPPGPGNPLGTRWMGISSPGVGIHGTPDPSSIGYSASHGCIRMYIPSAEWLFSHVHIGTQVFIVRP